MSPIINKLNLAGYFSYRVSENQGKLTNKVIDKKVILGLPGLIIRIFI